MDNVKFRAWNKKLKKMGEVFQLDFGQGAWVRFPNPEFGMDEGDFWENKDIILEQFIGRHDCKRTKEYPKGQEIYAGDIMEYYSACVPKGSNPHLRSIVNWNKIKCCFEGCFNGGEVIGNIHQNLEEQSGKEK